MVTAATPAAPPAWSCVVAGLLLWSVSPLLMLCMAALGVGLLVGCRLVWPDRWLAWLRLPVRAWWRGWFVYRHRWPAAMDTAGLATSWRGTDLEPHRPRRHVSTLTVDRVRVRMLPGQTVEDYAAVGDRLAQTFGATAVRVRSVPQRPHHVELWLLTADPLTAVVEPLPVDDQALTAGLPLALAEDGQHVAAAAGRLPRPGRRRDRCREGVGDLVAAAAPGPARSGSGLVQVWAVDPKGGMELAAGRSLFARFCHGDSDTAAGYEADVRRASSRTRSR